MGVRSSIPHRDASPKAFLEQPVLKQKSSSHALNTCNSAIFNDKQPLGNVATFRKNAAVVPGLKGKSALYSGQEKEGEHKNRDTQAAAKLKLRNLKAEADVNREFREEVPPQHSQGANTMSGTS